MRFSLLCVFALAISGPSWSQPGHSSQPRLYLLDMVAGGEGIVAVSGATPHGEVIWACSLTGSGPINSLYGRIELSHPIAARGSVYADARGYAEDRGLIPRSLSGKQIWFHAVDVNSGLLTNPKTVVLL